MLVCDRNVSVGIGILFVALSLLLHHVLVVLHYIVKHTLRKLQSVAATYSKSTLVIVHNIRSKLLYLLLRHNIRFRVLYFQFRLIVLCVVLCLFHMVKLHVLLAHEVHFHCRRVKHAKHVANAFSCSALIVKGNIARSNNQHSALIVLHEQHLTAILLLAVKLALVAPLFHMLLHGLRNLLLGATIHAHSLSLGVDIVGKRRKRNFIAISAFHHFQIYLRLRHSCILVKLIPLIEVIITFQGCIKRLLGIIHIVQHLSHSLIVGILRAKAILLNHVLALSLRLIGMQRFFRELLFLISLSQSHTSVLFLLAALQRVFVHSCL